MQHETTMSHLRPAVLYDHVPTEESIEFQKQFQTHRRQQRQQQQQQRQQQQQHHLNQNEITVMNGDAGKIDDSRNTKEVCLANLETDERQQQRKHDQVTTDGPQYPHLHDLHLQSSHHIQQRQPPPPSAPKEVAAPLSSSSSSSLPQNVGYYVSYMICQVSAPSPRHQQPSKPDKSQQRHIGERQKMHGEDKRVAEQQKCHNDDDPDCDCDDGDDFRFETILETDDADYIFVPPPTTTPASTPVTPTRREPFKSKQESLQKSFWRPSVAVSSQLPSSSTVVQIVPKGSFSGLLRFCWYTLETATKLILSTSQAPSQMQRGGGGGNIEWTNNSSTNSTTVFDEKGNGLILPGDCIDIDSDRRKMIASSLHQSSIYHETNIAAFDDCSSASVNTNHPSCLMEGYDNEHVTSHESSTNYDQCGGCGGYDGDDDNHGGALILPPATSHETSGSAFSLWPRTVPNRTASSLRTTTDIVKHRPSGHRNLRSSWLGGGLGGTKTIMICATDLLIIEQREKEERRRQQAKKEDKWMTSSFAKDLSECFEGSSSASFESRNSIMMTRRNISTFEQWISTLWYLTYRTISRERRQEESPQQMCSRLLWQIRNYFYPKVLREVTDEDTKSRRQTLCMEGKMYRFFITFSQKLKKLLYLDRRVLYLSDQRPASCNDRPESNSIPSGSESDTCTADRRDPCDDAYDVVQSDARRTEIELSKLG